MASKIAVRLGHMTNGELSRVEQLLKRFRLPVCTDLPASRLVEAMHKDKKKRGDSLYLILPVGIGKSQEVFVTYKELRSWLVE